MTIPYLGQFTDPRLAKLKALVAQQSGSPGPDSPAPDSPDLSPPDDRLAKLKALVAARTVTPGEADAAKATFGETPAGGENDFFQPTVAPAPRQMAASEFDTETPKATLGSYAKQYAAGLGGFAARLVPDVAIQTVRDLARTNDVAASLMQGTPVRQALLKATEKEGGSGIPSSGGSLYEKAQRPIDEGVTTLQNMAVGKPTEPSDVEGRKLGEMAGQVVSLLPVGMSAAERVLGRVSREMGAVRSARAAEAVIPPVQVEPPPPDPQPIESHAQPNPEREPVPSTPLRTAADVQKDAQGAMAAAQEAARRGSSNLAMQYQQQANKYARELRSMRPLEGVTPSEPVDNAAAGLPVEAGPSAPPSPEDRAAIDARVKELQAKKPTIADLLGKTDAEMEQVLHPSKGLPEGVSAPSQRASVEKITNEAMDQSAVDELVGEQTAKPADPRLEKLKQIVQQQPKAGTSPDVTAADEQLFNEWEKVFPPATKGMKAENRPMAKEFRGQSVMDAEPMIREREAAIRERHGLPGERTYEDNPYWSAFHSKRALGVDEARRTILGQVLRGGGGTRFTNPDTRLLLLSERGATDEEIAALVRHGYNDLEHNGLKLPTEQGPVEIATPEREHGVGKKSKFAPKLTAPGRAPETVDIPMLVRQAREEYGIGEPKGAARAKPIPATERFTVEPTEKGFGVRDRTRDALIEEGTKGGKLRTRHFPTQEAAQAWIDEAVPSVQHAEGVIARREAKAAKAEPLPTDVSHAETGKPFKARLLRGQGRTTSPYSERAAGLPIVGEGRYTTPSREYAEHFGPNVTQHDVSLKNPLVIENDQQWGELTKRAGWEFRNPTGLPPEQVQREIAKLRSIVEGEGHDGMVIKLDKRGDYAKTLRDVFGADQAIEFKKAPLPDTAPERFSPSDAKAYNEATAGSQMAGDLQRAVKGARQQQTEFLAEKGMTWEQARALPEAERVKLQAEWTARQSITDPEVETLVQWGHVRAHAERTVAEKDVASDEFKAAKIQLRQAEKEVKGLTTSLIERHGEEKARELVHAEMQRNPDKYLAALVNKKKLPTEPPPIPKRTLKPKANLDKLAKQGADVFTSPKGTSLEETAESSHARNSYARQRDRLSPADRETLHQKIAAELAKREPKGDPDDLRQLAKSLRKYGYADAADRYEAAAGGPSGASETVRRQRTTEADLRREALWQRLMQGQDVGAELTPADARAFTARLDAAPGDNAAARRVLAKVLAPKKLTINPDSPYAGEDPAALLEGSKEQAEWHMARTVQAIQNLATDRNPATNRKWTPKQIEANKLDLGHSRQSYAGTMEEIRMAFGDEVGDKVAAEIEAKYNLGGAPKEAPAPKPKKPKGPAKVKFAGVTGGNPKFAKMDNEALIARRHELIDRIDEQNKILDKNVTPFARDRGDGTVVSGTSVNQAAGRAIGQIKTAGRILGELDEEFKVRGISDEQLADALDEQAERQAIEADENINPGKNPPGFTAFSHGSVGGGIVGAAAGVQADKKHPGRGALIGAIAGAALGAKLTKVLAANPVTEGKLVTPGIKDDLLTMLAPASRGGGGEEAGYVMRHRFGEQAASEERARESLKGFRRIVAHLSTPDAHRFIDHIEQGQIDVLPKPLQPIALQLRKVLDETRDEIIALGNGRLTHYYETYFPHIWKDPAKARDVIKQILGKRPLEGNKNFLRKRSIMSVSEGLDAGLELATDNPLDLVLLKHREMRRYLMGQRVLNDFKEEGLATFVNATEKPPDGYRRIDDRVAEVRGPGPKGAITIRGHYWAPEPVARVINNHLSPGLRGRPLYDGYMYLGNLMNMVQLGLSAFHLGFTSIDAVVSKVALGILEAKDLHPIKAAKALAEAPLAPATNIWRGVKLRHAYLNGVDDPMVNGIIEGGGRVRMDSFWRNNAAESFLHAVQDRDLKGIGKHAIPAFFDMASKPILEWVVPRQKLGVFADLYSHELAKLPADATPMMRKKIASKVWDSVDNRMGQMVYDNLFWNRTLKDLAFASVRSVGWNLGTIRELGGGALDLSRGKMTPRASYAIALPITVGLMGAITTYLYTGHGPKSIKDYFLPPTGKVNEDGNQERVQLPSYVKDVIAYRRHPLETLGHKAQPFLATIIDMLKNKDYYGDQIRNRDDSAVQQAIQAATYLARQFIPFGVRNAMQERTHQQSTSTKVGPFFGMTPAPRELVRSPAQQKMAEILGDRGYPSRTPEEVKASETRRTMLDQFRAGTLTKHQIADSARAGVLSHRQALDMQRRGTEPNIVQHFKQLRWQQAEDVYSAANADERKLWWPILWKKRLGALDQLLDAGAKTPDVQRLRDLIHRDHLHGPPPTTGASP